MADHKIRKDGRVALALTRAEIVRMLQVLDAYKVVATTVCRAAAPPISNVILDDGPVMAELRSALLSLDLIESLCGVFGQDGE